MINTWSQSRGHETSNYWSKIMKTRYRLEVLRSKSYRPMYEGKLSQCFKRLSESVRDRARIKKVETGEVIHINQALTLD